MESILKRMLNSLDNSDCSESSGIRKAHHPLVDKLKVVVVAAVSLGAVVAPNTAFADSKAFIVTCKMSGYDRQDYEVSGKGKSHYLVGPYSTTIYDEDGELQHEFSSRIECIAHRKP